MKKSIPIPWLVLLLTGCSDEAGATREPARPTPIAVTPEAEVVGRRGFDRMAPDKLPEGWRVAGTRQAGPLATWSVVADPSAPTPPHALALTSPNHGSESTYNLCWDERSRFQDGVFELSFKANGGTMDQGGGPVWRLLDENNYYVCRANPLEANFRLYVVKNGERKELASAPAQIASGAWHTLRVEHKGDEIVCTLDGSVRIEAKDATLPEPGAVGLWTKADAATAFDELSVRPKK